MHTAALALWTEMAISNALRDNDPLYSASYVTSAGADLSRVHDGSVRVH